ncbi:MAG TPA: hypothetical protein VHF06_34045 [Pseudonocardiaceae bacterium]|jgi:vacuolar-type H+-ATPase subunit F/Vma7|nr:hypothetical protein [Pseudonocardiaceae bacterium]
MAGVAVIGAWSQVRGWVLSGATVHGAEGTEAVRAAWRDAIRDASVVVLTDQAGADLTEERAAPDGPLVAVIPS